MNNDTIKALDPWKESLLRLPENKFLNIVRMYVGTIKTPYNKERLVTELVSFLYKEEHRKNIFSLLSEKDILFLSAVHIFDSPTNETLLTFFAGDFTNFYLYDYIANLEERLLLYRFFDERNKKEYLAINPLLYDTLKDFLSVSVLLPLSEKRFEAEISTPRPVLRTSLFCAWYAFISQYPDTCRADGSFKKKRLASLETIFFGLEPGFLQDLNTACINLGLFFHDGSNLCPNEKKWKVYSFLPLETQCVYICISSFRRFSKDMLVKHAIFVKNLLSSIPNSGFTKESLLRLSFIIRNTHNESVSNQKLGFFANVLQRAQNPTSTDEDIFSDSSLIDKLINFGLLKSLGQDKNGKNIYCKNDVLDHQEKTANKPFISINAGFSITFLTPIELETMLSLASCMNIESYDTVCRFEITRSSCMRSFDKGETNESLLTNLEQAFGKPLPQNLTYSINEWFETYNSASLYHGYILQVTPEKVVQIENCAVLAKRIKKVLAPGIYLFDFETKEDMIEAIEKSSLDFIGFPKNVIKEPEALPFSDVQTQNPIIIDNTKKTQSVERNQQELLENMKKELEKMHLPIEQKEGLLERIDRKLIITPKQLVGETVRTEKTEASGIDFMGKIQVIEQAIASSNMLEITSANGVFIGRPVKIEKRDGDASLTLTQEDSKSILLLIGQARNVKRFRQPLH